MVQEKQEFQKASSELLSSFSVRESISSDIETSQDYLGFLGCFNSLFHDFREKEKKNSGRLNLKIKSLETKLEHSSTLREVIEKRFEALEESYRELRQKYFAKESRVVSEDYYQKFLQFLQEIKYCDKKKGNLKTFALKIQNELALLRSAYTKLQKVFCFYSFYFRARIVITMKKL